MARTLEIFSTGHFAAIRRHTASRGNLNSNVTKHNLRSAKFREKDNLRSVWAHSLSQKFVISCNFEKLAFLFSEPFFRKRL